MNDNVDARVVDKLDSLGVGDRAALRRIQQCRSKGGGERGLTVVRVPGYSPYAAAEHAVGLMLALNRKPHRAYNRVREGNFALDGLLGFDVRQNRRHHRHGKIGTVVAKILIDWLRSARVRSSPE
ncbi:MAG: hypothetical protein Udaeo2_30350 [Candidatus Udaeobacter sp.]|nr:MAG: hypothetical protein Udaeo2_30350 [Candidatus Udaeobacter sp.]